MPRPDRSKFGYGSGKPSSPPPEPVSDAIGMQPPARVRYGADRWITHEVVEAAIKEYEERSGREVRRVRMETVQVKRQVLNSKQQPRFPMGFREIDLKKDQELARSGI